MLFCNGNIFLPEGFVYGGFRTENGRFAQILPGLGTGEGTDLGGRKVIPGLVDIHIHGCAGADFSDGDEEGLRRMGKYLAEHGTTSFLPTSMSLPYERLETVFGTAARLKEEPGYGCARILGIHMEGPWFSEKKKGAQSGACLRDPDISAFEALLRGCSGLIRMADLAPELPGAAEFASLAAGSCRISAAHTDAGYGEASAFFDAGASHLTHLFNAMPPLLHRSPGPIGAASEREWVTAELICDGVHVHPSAVRAAFRLFPERICLISDALRCCGMPDGKYELGGQTVTLRGKRAFLPDGTLAGSAACLFDCMKNAISFGIPEETAIRAASLVPAGAIGAGQEAGSIAAGLPADFIVCDGDYRQTAVYLGGTRL